jgi:hypothetical protein
MTDTMLLQLGFAMLLAGLALCTLALGIYIFGRNQ